MELRPGMIFDLAEETYQFVGVEKDATQGQERVVARLNPSDPDSGLHRVFPLQDVAENAANFWVPTQEYTRQEFSRQYDELVGVFDSVELLRTLPTGEKGIFGVDGKAYPIPTKEQITTQIFQETSLFAKKFSQGFNRLLIVPTGMNVDTYIQLFRGRVLEHRKAGKLFAAGLAGEFENENIGTADEDLFTGVDVQTSTTRIGESPIWLENNLRYNLEDFSTPQEQLRQRDFIPKKELLAAGLTTFPGWDVLFVEDLPFYPTSMDNALGRVAQKNGRKPITVSLSRSAIGGAGFETVFQSVKTRLKNAAHAHESGLTPEDFLTYCLLKLETDDIWVGTEMQERQTEYHPALFSGEDNYFAAAFGIQANRYRCIRSTFRNGTKMVIGPDNEVNKHHTFRTAVRIRSKKT